jgi:GAF domain-containing protein
MNDDLPSHALAELGRIDLREHDLAAVLGRIAEVAKRTIPGTAEASFTLIEAGEARTAAYTGKMALALDERQYEEERGPCLDAAAGSVLVSVADMATDDRWRKFAEAALAAGVGSSLSMGIPIQDVVVGALNMYGTTPRAFDDASIDLARTFAGYAAIALANAHLYSSSAALAVQMRQAMESRSVIDQAIGVTMVQERCSPTQAFDLLVRLSQASNRKLRDVAQMMVDARTAQTDHE